MKIVAIGGGAAGFFGAIAAAEASPHAQVTLLEASPQVLAKVRISGGGRCNVTHACFDPTALVQYYPRGGKALRGSFARFQPHDTVAWFESRGVALKTEPDGRMFPTTDDSATIVDCLVHTAQRAGVQVATGAAATEVIPSASGFTVQLKGGKTIGCDRLFLATGSHPLGYRLAASLGHQLVPPVPSLFTFNISDPRLAALAGVSVPLVRVKLLVEGQKPLEQEGPLLITHWGASGPAVLKLSAWGARLLYDARYRAAIQVNWLPALKVEVLRGVLLRVKEEWARKAISKHCPVALPQRLWQRLVESVGIDPELRWADLSKKALNLLLLELTQGQFEIRGKGIFKDEFVTCGGIPLAEVNFKTMESRCCPGLYFAGEILDVDGVTGGFNFQNAWTTGWIAGQAMGG
ncbi:NAD(P)/FAD-dependent oxidoreductase [Altericista sp. CCNU0014]|uniref:NAD(P)/FAD-dependent oxidoreductase n=1 Tax=Altericista sp. CCNU0014 TaxID=3082949 RepID=UPI00384F99C4